MKRCGILVVILSIVLIGSHSRAIGSEKAWSTIDMGGIKVAPDQLREMQQGKFILHAKGGRLRKVPVEKTSLLLDPYGHVQICQVFAGPGQAIYASQSTVLSKSIDRGRTWEHQSVKLDPGMEFQKVTQGNNFLNFQVLPDGTWIRGIGKGGEIFILASVDQGRSWTERGRFGKELGVSDLRLSSPKVLRDGRLLVAVTAVSGEPWPSPQGKRRCLLYRSKDGGKTFLPPTRICEWGHEMNIDELPTGKLLVSIRYQRPLLPEDPPDILQKTGSAKYGAPFPYKHVFVADSMDGGESWSPVRQVCTDHGQCYGDAVGLTKGRVVMVYDHRYPRNASSARAIISDDEAHSWRDEVYYLSHGDVAGYAMTVTLDGEEMLTITGSFYANGGPAGWGDLLGRTRQQVIRWRLED